MFFHKNMNLPIKKAILKYLKNCIEEDSKEALKTGMSRQIVSVLKALFSMIDLLF